MKKLSIFKSVIASAAILAVAITGTKAVSAAQIPWTGVNLPSITTPVFNTYTDIPNGVGNEADFVRLRKSNGDPTNPAVNNDFVDPVNAACTVGEKFDIRTYVHNGADDKLNKDGKGSSVANNVSVAMKAPLNVNSKKFVFNSTVSATNAASVSDNGTLNCGDEVQLKLVPKTVKVYSRHTGWNSAADSAVNGNLAIGSRKAGSGSVWGCWNDRVVVVYVVEVVETPEVPVTPVTPETPVTPVTPETPPVTIIPATGIGGIMGGLLGASATGYGATMLYQKQHSLKNRK